MSSLIFNILHTDKVQSGNFHVTLFSLQNLTSSTSSSRSRL